MKGKHYLIVVLLTLVLFTLTSLIHKNSVCCMFASIRSYGFPGQFIVISKETNLLEEAQKVNTSPTKELLKQGWRIKFGASIDSPISQSAPFNIAVNFLLYFTISFICVFLSISHKKLVKEFVKSLLFIFVFGVLVAFLYFYMPSSVRELNEKISLSNSTDSSIARLNLFKEYGDFMEHKLPQKTPAMYFYWYSNQRKISDLRVKKAVDEIKNTSLSNNEIKIWSLLNMGVVVKTYEKTIAIDTANLPFSQAFNELVDIVDIFIVTHMDGDHYDSTLLKKALGNNKKVVFLEGIYALGDKSKNISVASGETKDIDGVKITAYQTDHRGDGNFNDPCAWFVVDIGGFKLLHTGDGREFKNKNEQQKIYSMKDFDILLVNNQLHPYNIRDLSPKVLIPLHLFKFMSGNDLYQESTIETVSENYARYSKDLQGIKKIYLLPGEGYLHTLKIR